MCNELSDSHLETTTELFICFIKIIEFVVVIQYSSWIQLSIHV